MISSIITSHNLFAFIIISLMPQLFENNFFFNFDNIELWLIIQKFINDCHTKCILFSQFYLNNSIIFQFTQNKSKHIKIYVFMSICPGLMKGPLTNRRLAETTIKFNYDYFRFSDVQTLRGEDFRQPPFFKERDHANVCTKGKRDKSSDFPREAFINGP